MQHLAKGGLEQGETHLYNQERHDECRNIFNSSMAKGMVVIRWFFRHFDSHEPNDGGRCIRQVIECIRHDRYTVHQDSNKKLGCKKQQVAADSHHAGQRPISRPYLHILHIIMVFHKFSY